MKITKADIAGWRIETDDKTYYVGEYHSDGLCEGVIYKDRAAFESGKGVCYINEYGFDNSDQNGCELFEFNAKAAVALGLEGNPYTTDCGYTRQDFEDLVADTKYTAKDIFESVGWQSPETLLDEWLDDDDEQEELEKQIEKGE